MFCGENFKLCDKSWPSVEDGLECFKKLLLKSLDDIVPFKLFIVNEEMLDVDGGKLWRCGCWIGFLYDLSSKFEKNPIPYAQINIKNQF